MTIESRIARLEAKLSQRSKVATSRPPVFVVGMPLLDEHPDADTLRVARVVHEGQTWLQQASESLEDFERRVVDAALLTFRPSHPFQPLTLVVNLPRMGSAGGHSA